MRQRLREASIWLELTEYLIERGVRDWIGMGAWDRLDKGQGGVERNLP